MGPPESIPTTFLHVPVTFLGFRFEDLISGVFASALFL